MDMVRSTGFSRKSQRRLLDGLRNLGRNPVFHRLSYLRTPLGRSQRIGYWGNPGMSQVCQHGARDSASGLETQGESGSRRPWDLGGFAAGHARSQEEEGGKRCVRRQGKRPAAEDVSSSALETTLSESLTVPPPILAPPAPSAAEMAAVAAPTPWRGSGLPWWLCRSLAYRWRQPHGSFGPRANRKR